jgi:hypothetical protein
MPSPLLLLLLLPLLLQAASATNIKFTPGDNSGEAARAPRSQKYWNEHNIEKPDYAKTDAEVFQERVAAFWNALGSTQVKVALAAVLGTALLLFARASLGGGQGAAPMMTPEQAEEARAARLERFAAAAEPAEAPPEGAPPESALQRARREERERIAARGAERFASRRGGE